MPPQLKNLYNQDYIRLLSANIALHYSKFNTQDFTQKIFDDTWQTQELKQRMRHISSTLGQYLPQEYSQSITILKATFYEMNSNEYRLQNMIFQDFVEVYGMDDFSLSMNALECFTINASSEFAIRRFILKYPRATMARMREWAHNSNEHIRRLSSEGCRPRLPWAVALGEFKSHPHEVLAILEILKDDPSQYVRKSVANNLNDISKDNPNIVKQIVQKWRGDNQNTDWILKHACRTLLKQADKEILEIFGFNEDASTKIDSLTLTKQVSMGGTLDFSFLLSCAPNTKLRVEYALSFIRQNNKHNTKVFKIFEGVHSYDKNKIAKHYSFQPISTRKYYKGLHKLAIIINGVVLDEKGFFLV